MKRGSERREGERGEQEGGERVGGEGECSGESALWPVSIASARLPFPEGA